MSGCQRRSGCERAGGDHRLRAREQAADCWPAGPRTRCAFRAPARAAHLASRLAASRAAFRSSWRRVRGAYRPTAFGLAAAASRGFGVLTVAAAAARTRLKRLGFAASAVLLPRKATCVLWRGRRRGRLGFRLRSAEQVAEQAGDRLRLLGRSNAFLRLRRRLRHRHARRHHRRARCLRLLRLTARLASGGARRGGARQCAGRHAIAGELIGTAVIVESAAASRACSRTPGSCRRRARGAAARCRRCGRCIRPSGTARCAACRAPRRRSIGSSW